MAARLKKKREASLFAQTGWCWYSNSCRTDQHHPVCAAAVASPHSYFALTQGAWGQNEHISHGIPACSDLQSACPRFAPRVFSDRFNTVQVPNPPHHGVKANGCIAPTWCQGTPDTQTCQFSVTLRHYVTPYPRVLSNRFQFSTFEGLLVTHPNRSIPIREK